MPEIFTKIASIIVARRSVEGTRWKPFAKAIVYELHVYLCGQTGLNSIVLNFCLRNVTPSMIIKVIHRL